MEAFFLLAMEIEKRTAEPNGRNAKSRVSGVSTDAMCKDGAGDQGINRPTYVDVSPNAPRTSSIAAVKSVNPVLGTMMVFRRP